MNTFFNKIAIIAIIVLISQGLYAQSIEGRILSDRNEPLSGVSVELVGTSAGTSSDVEGRFIIRVPSAGSYSLQFSAIGYQTKIVQDIVVKPNEKGNIEIYLDTDNQLLSSVVVKTSARKESVQSLLNFQRNSPTIADGISAEIIKKSPDKNSSEVLKRVSGTSIQENKFVVVRGLIDRYNVATLNNALLPSSEPDRRAFSFDIIPSQLLDNIIIYKTANPDLPGDFAGGVVQVSTKDVPNENFLQLGGGLSYNSLSTGKKFNIGYLSSTDYLGFDDGARSLPGSFPGRRQFQTSSFNERAAYSARVKNTYGERYHGKALPNQSYQMTWGKRMYVGEEGVIGSILSLSYRNSQNMVSGIRSEYDNQFESVNGAAYTYNDTTYKFNTTLGALWNLAYKKGNTKVSFRNLFNRSFESSNLIRSGYQYYSSGAIITAQGSETIIKTLYSSQIDGEHALSAGKKISWNLNYALSLRDNPDYKFAPFIKDSSAAFKDLPASIVLRDTYRFFAELQEHAFGANAHYASPLIINDKRLAQLKVGVSSQMKDRSFDARIFRYNRTPQAGFNEGILTMDPKYIFSSANMNPQGLALEEITNNTDQYDATTYLHAGYLMLDHSINSLWRIVWGVRAEAFGFTVNTADFSGAKVKATKDYVDILPSLNITYHLTDISNLRFSASRTVARPELREVANFSFYDFVRNVQVRGNTRLERSQHSNMDLRYEIYPSNGEIFSVSAFFKHFKNPIELRVDPGSNPLNLIFEYYNATSATSYGIEAEVRKKLSFLGNAEGLNNWIVFANAALIRSKVNVEGLDVAVADEDRPMQGQSPYLLNAGITYTHPQNGLSLSALVNRIGHRIEAVGNDPKGLPDIYENGRTLIDLQISKRMFNQKGELKLNISDLLNQSVIFYQNYRTDTDRVSSRSYKASEDRIWNSMKFGTNIGLSFSYSF